MVEEIQRTLEMVMRRVSRRMAEHGFSLALEKIEADVLAKKRVPTVYVVKPWSC